MVGATQKGYEIEYDTLLISIGKSFVFVFYPHLLFAKGASHDKAFAYRNYRQYG